MRPAVLREFANTTREVHSIAAGGSFGALTGFLWVRYSRTVALALGLVFLSVVTGIRLTRILKRATGGQFAAKNWVADTTDMLRQLRAEGHYTVTSFTVFAAAVYVVLIAV